MTVYAHDVKAAHYVLPRHYSFMLFDCCAIDISHFAHTDTLTQMGIWACLSVYTVV